MNPHPLETTLTLSDGTSYRVLYSFLGWMHAEERHGYDTSLIELDAESLRERADEAVSRSQRLRAMLEPVWFGVLTYQPEISLEELARQVRTQFDFAALAACWGHVVAYQAAEPERSEDEEGKPVAEATSEPSASAT